MYIFQSGCVKFLYFKSKDLDKLLCSLPCLYFSITYTKFPTQTTSDLKLIIQPEADLIHFVLCEHYTTKDQRGLGKATSIVCPGLLHVEGGLCPVSCCHTRWWRLLWWHMDTRNCSVLHIPPGISFGVGYMFHSEIPSEVWKITFRYPG